MAHQLSGASIATPAKRVAAAKGAAAPQVPSGAQACTIRRAQPGDAERLHDIIQSAYRSERSWTTEARLVKGERITLEQLTAQLQPHHTDPIFAATFAVAGGAEEVAGCICAEWAKQHPNLGLSDTCAMLGLFAVAPEHQSQRIGSSLFQHAMQHAKDEWGCSEAVMWVIKQRKELLQWYYRMGFEWHGQKREFVFPDLQLQDDIEFLVLRKSLC